MKDIQMINQKYQACIEACAACAATCIDCAACCPQETDAKELTRCMTLCQDSAELCKLASAAMARNSENVKVICSLCADICQACADECAKYQMSFCQECAKACRLCAQECQKVAAAV